MDQGKPDGSGEDGDASPLPHGNNETPKPILELERREQPVVCHETTRAFELLSIGNSHDANPSKSTTAPSFHAGPPLKENSSSPDSRNEYGMKAVEKGCGEGTKDARKVSTNSNLSIDTSCATSEINEYARRKDPFSPVSPESSIPLSATSSPLKSPTSPISPRTRDRGSSLRRLILARNIHGQPESSGSATELQPVREAVRHVSSLSSSDGISQKPETMVTVSSTRQQVDAENRNKSTKKSDALSSLPHYETWIASKAARSSVCVEFRAIKERMRKKILRIRDIPPSKDGRHLQMSIDRKEPLIDDRTGHAYIDNTILSSRYTLYNFLPRQLFAQFSKLANFYFLCVSILQMIPGLSTTGTYTTIVPLLFFVTISIAKEGYDDWRRYRLDKGENNRTAYVLHTQKSLAAGANIVSSGGALTEGNAHWVETMWRDIRVGDIVRLTRNDAVPADIAVLQAKGAEDVAYIETMALDGETNLKSRQAPPVLSERCRTQEDLAKCSAHFVLEDPNLDLYSFEGKVSLGDEVLPLGNNEIIYRGSIVRNTSEVTGLVIYTGEECKIRMNATKNPRIKAVSGRLVHPRIRVGLIYLFSLHSKL